MYVPVYNNDNSNDVFKFQNFITPNVADRNDSPYFEEKSLKTVLSFFQK